MVRTAGFVTGLALMIGGPFIMTTKDFSTDVQNVSVTTATSEAAGAKVMDPCALLRIFLGKYC